jgi:hypothetical protein
MAWPLLLSCCYDSPHQLRGGHVVAEEQTRAWIERTRILRLEKLGMRREGYLREVELVASGEWRDIYLYALLVRE